MQTSAINPAVLSPQEDVDDLLDGHLSQEKLRKLAHEENLDNVKHLELQFDSRRNGFANIGESLPNLRTLILIAESYVSSLRELGSSLHHIQVLSVCNCNITDLDGVAAFSSIRELRASGNRISDLSPLSTLEHLETLDLRENIISDAIDIDYLALVPTLSSLFLDGNPVSRTESDILVLEGDQTRVEDPEERYRGMVFGTLPALLLLDGQPRGAKRPLASPGGGRTPGSGSESGSGSARASSARSRRGTPRMSWTDTGQDLTTAHAQTPPSTSTSAGASFRRPSTPLLSKFMPEIAGQAADSDLTRGGDILCGGGALALLRARRKSSHSSAGSRSLPPTPTSPSMALLSFPSPFPRPSSQLDYTPPPTGGASPAASKSSLHPTPPATAAPSPRIASPRRTPPPTSVSPTPPKDDATPPHTFRRHRYTIPGPGPGTLPSRSLLEYACPLQVQLQPADIVDGTSPVVIISPRRRSHGAGVGVGVGFSH
ncbi:outer arm dynein light chain 1 [Gonapodya prolifera JEL478]|uniref:Outer arm dynein light chain 1 n=1 Tax=Gonapodya prolifera (strain JEL478) TaxID=1344416 RepID=A0A139AGY2_GONPJ|nr:outer arm dynein light chain 1 [Gonapodya prolifera JEL478]|eukprot:KXS16071.1 outer arm dynein light chain 1 [Gonapodya prolifera JEL478]